MSESGTRSRILSAVRRWWEPALLVLVLALFTAGGIAWLTGADGTSDALWVAATVVVLPVAAGEVLVAVLRGTFGVDLIAVLTLAGTLAIGEYLAGALIAVMLSTGDALEATAARRATRDLRALLERAPRTARRRVGDTIIEVPVGEVAVGDVVLVGAR